MFYTKNHRLNNFREMIKQKGLDGALIYKDANRNYLTRCNGEESMIILTSKDAIYITDSRYREQAQTEAIGFEVKEYKGNIVTFLGDEVKDLGIKCLGFEEDFMTYSMYTKLCSSLKDVKLVALEGIVEKLRAVKDQDEINNIEKAAVIADDGFSYILEHIKPGMTEMEIGLKLEFYLRSRGASGLSFTPVIASGKRSSLPHGRATSKVVVVGDFLTLDFGCMYNGYCSDMTRTVIIGTASNRQREIYDIVLKANKRALEHIKPGITGEALDSIARNYISDRGYGDYFGHGLGHGVGMEIHELPYISKRGKDPLESGMVITDEPGIYIPDFGGVRIEDLIVVIPGGFKVLSKSQKELIELN